MSLQQKILFCADTRYSFRVIYKFHYSSRNPGTQIYPVSDIAKDYIRLSVGLDGFGKVTAGQNVSTVEGGTLSIDGADTLVANYTTPKSLDFRYESWFTLTFGCSNSYDGGRVNNRNNSIYIYDIQMSPDGIFWESAGMQFKGQNGFNQSVNVNTQTKTETVFYKNSRRTSVPLPIDGPLADPVGEV